MGTIALENTAFDMPTVHLRRGDLPDYSGPSCREGYAPKYVGRDMGRGMEINERGNAAITSIAAAGAAALACMAQHYGAIDSSYVSGAIDLLGSAGTIITAAVPAYILGRVAQDLI